MRKPSILQREKGQRGNANWIGTKRIERVESSSASEVKTAVRILKRENVAYSVGLVRDRDCLCVDESEKSHVSVDTTSNRLGHFVVPCKTPVGPLELQETVLDESHVDVCHTRARSKTVQHCSGYVCFSVLSPEPSRRTIQLMPQQGIGLSCLSRIRTVEPKSISPSGSPVLPI